MPEESATKGAPTECASGTTGRRHVAATIVNQRAQGVRRWRPKNHLTEMTVPIEPPHPRRTLQALDDILNDLRAFSDADPENETLRDAETTAIALQKLLSAYSDAYVSKGT
jgi:hypothetical protein